MKRYLTATALLFLASLALVWAADEVSVTTVLTVENGQFKLNRQVNNYKVDQVEQASDYGIQDTTNSVTNLLNIANVSTPRYCFFRNLDETNVAVFVTLTLKLDPGDVAVCPVYSTNMTTYTTNGGTKIEYWVNER